MAKGKRGDTVGSKQFTVDTFMMQEQKELEEMASMNLDEAAYIGLDSPLNEAQEKYCQLRAQGFTQTKAARIAWPNCNHPGKYGHNVEKKIKVRERILEIRKERSEISDSVDAEEQMRKYHDIYQLCMETGKVALAMKALERIDVLAGFIVSKSEHVNRSTVNPAAANPNSEESVNDALSKFDSILKSHGERPKHQN